MIRTLCYFCLVSFPMLVNAQQVLRLPEPPAWALVIDSLQPRPAITSAEQAVLRQLKPLIEQQKYRQALAIVPAEIRQDSALLLSLAGQLELALQDYAEAIATLTEALRLSSDNEIALQNIATAHLALEQLEEARPYLIKVLQSNQGSAQVYAQLAYINLQTATPASAVVAYQHAVMLAPNNSAYQEGLLYALIRSGAYDSAATLLDDVLQQSPNKTNAWLQRAQLAIDQHHWTIALSSLETATQLSPQKPLLALQLADLHSRQGSRIRAMALLQRTEVTTTDTHALAQGISERLVQDALSTRDWPGFNDALAQLKRFSDNTSDDAKLTFYEAEALYQQRDYASAEPLYAKVIEHQPGHGEALLRLAQLAHQKQHITQAKLLYQRAQTLPSVQEQAQLGLVQIALEQRDYRTAYQQLSDLLEQFPHRLALRETLQALEQLL